MPKISAVGFDLDNTLYPMTSGMQSRVRLGIYEKLSQLIKVPVESAKAMFEEGYLRLNSGTKAIAEISGNYGVDIGRRDIVQESLEEADLLEFIQPNPELGDMMHRLSQVYSLDLITGCAQELALQKLAKIGIHHRTFSLSFYDTSGSKADATPFHAWIIARAVPPNELIYVGDNRRTDVEIPKSLGIQTCFLGNDAGADFHIQSILDLEEILKYCQS